MKDFDLFEGTTFSSLLKDIHDNSKKRSVMVETLINDLRDMVEDPSDAVMIVPIIVQYLDIGVKNDRHLIDLANIVEKYSKQVNKVKADAGMGSLTEQEAAELYIKYRDELQAEVLELDTPSTGELELKEEE